MSEWISVKQELPPYAAEVIVYTAGTCTRIMRRTGNYSGWMYSGNEYRGVVTHWMPLPAPPLSEDKPTESHGA